MTDINTTFRIFDRMFIWLGGTTLLALAAVGAANVYTGLPPLAPCYEDEARVEWVMPDGGHGACIALDNLNWERADARYYRK